MIFNSKEKFDEYAYNIVFNESECCECVFFIIRTGYSMVEMLNDHFNIECAMPYFPHNDEPYSVLWFNDWYEGQNFIEVYDYYHEQELLHKLQHTQHKDGLEDYKP